MDSPISPTDAFALDSHGYAHDVRYEAVLDEIHRARGLDLSGYKRSSVERQIQRRMRARRVERYADYLVLLQDDPAEVRRLLDNLLVNVTTFFRDVDAWMHLATEVIPRILERKGSDAPLKIWSAGCSTGEEAYALGILLSEALGPEDYACRVRIHATDLDEVALARARRGRYRMDQLEALPEHLRSKYFLFDGRFATVRRSIRDAMVFGRHDLAASPPISQVDLLACRNVLIYFTPQAQSDILTRLHFGLSDLGVLFLGKHETLVEHTDLFAPVQVSHRLFEKVPSRKSQTRRNGSSAPAITVQDQPRLRNARLRPDAAATVMLDAHGRLAQFDAGAQRLFRLEPDDLGEPLSTLCATRPRVEALRSIAQTAQAGTDTVVHRGIECSIDDATRHEFDVCVVPLHHREETQGTLVLYLDVTSDRQLRAALEQTTEDLATTNEELSTVNEALQTTNERLVSSNQALHHSNEALRSASEEADAANASLRARNEAFHAVLHHLAQPLAIFVGHDMVFCNASARAVLGVGAHEGTGIPFSGPAPGPKMEALEQLIQRAQELPRDHSVSERLVLCGRMVEATATALAGAARPCAVSIVFGRGESAGSG